LTKFGNDLIAAMGEVVAHISGEKPGIIHVPVFPQRVRKAAGLKKSQMAVLMGMSVPRYRKWERHERMVRGLAAALLELIRKEPEAVKRALLR
jgi:putative transcriptional regulator